MVSADRGDRGDRALATNDTGDARATFLHEAVRLQAEHRGLVDALEH